MKKPIKTALTAFGMSGQVFHGPLLKAHPDFEITKILERSKNLSRKDYPDTQLVRDFNDLIQDKEVELIIINTPENSHYELACKALKAGKHVVTEKPFTQTVAQGEELIELAEKNNCMLSVFQNRRWDSDFLTVSEVIKKQFLGRLVEFESHFDRYRNFIKPDTWKEDPETGTGTLYNLGSHLIDQALQLFGIPQSVWADIRALRTGAKVDDSFDIFLQYPDVKVTLKASYLVRQPGPRYILHGTHGSFLKYGTDVQEEDLKQGMNQLHPNWGAEPKSLWGMLDTEIDGMHFMGKIESFSGAYQKYYDNIFEVIRNNKELIVKPCQALDVIKIIEAAKESNEMHKAVKP